MYANVCHLGPHNPVYTSFMCTEVGTWHWQNLFRRQSAVSNVFVTFIAIRQDRTRGGRSSYEGCSPHGKPRPSPVQRKLKRPTSVGSSEEDSKAGVMAAHPGAEVMQPGEEGKSHRQLVAILNHSNRHGQQVSDFVLFWGSAENLLFFWGGSAENLLFFWVCRKSLGFLGLQKISSLFLLFFGLENHFVLFHYCGPFCFISTLEINQKLS